MKLTLVLMSLLGIVSLSGCSRPNECAWAKPLNPEVRDVRVISDSLADQILVHNLTGQEICNWKTP
jgi:hypothetical protein